MTFEADGMGAVAGHDGPHDNSEGDHDGGYESRQESNDAGH